jgi:pimeloyl-ACP methyl ester carboxylesterase
MRGHDDGGALVGFFAKHRAFIAALVLWSAWCATPAVADEIGRDKIGIVLMHGKLGTPLGVAAGPQNIIGGRLVMALRRAGYLVATPEMCWSRYRGFDLTYTDCFRDIDAAIADLKGRGATAIVVGGQSLGGNATLGYGAVHPGLFGVIAFAAADDPRSKARRPDIAATIAKAQALVAQGKGDEKTNFDDVNTGPQGSYKMSLDTTPRIYLSFFAPDSPAGLADNAAKLTAPLLWIAGTRDPTQRSEPAYAFDHAPPNPLNQFVSVDASHLETPDAGTDATLAWLDRLRGAH